MKTRVPTVEQAKTCHGNGVAGSASDTTSVVLEGGSGSGVRRCGGVWEHVEVRVGSHQLSQTPLTVTICFESEGR